MARCLAIDTVTAACSVALFDDDRLLDWRHEHVGRGHAERLVPMIADLPDHGRADVIRVDVGPGSFTGLRIGLAAARALALVWGARVEGYVLHRLLAAMARADHPGMAVDVVTAGGHGDWILARFDAAGTMVDAPLARSPDATCDLCAAPLVAGDLADQLVATCGHGLALAPFPDARCAMLLGQRDLTPPTAQYARPPDARPAA